VKRIALVAACVLACSIGVVQAHAQTTIIRYGEPDPDKVRVEKLSDEEVASLAKLSDAREKALETYLAARDSYEKTKGDLQQKYHAYSQEGDCNKPKVDVEWKGKFIIVEEFPAQGNGIFGGGCGGMTITPAWSSTLAIGTPTVTK
jgi:hypothetical protein